MAKRHPIRGRRALITGAARGIGLAIAQDLARQGASLVLTDIDETELKKVSQKLSFNDRSDRIQSLDVRDGDAFAALVAGVEEEVGAIDILINNAGIMSIGAFLEQPADSDTRQIDINVRGVINGVRAVLPFMSKRNKGQIVNIASVAGMVGTPNAAVYPATKFAVVGLTQALHMEYANTGLTFAYVCPSLVQTELIHGAVEPKWPKPVTADDVAGTVRYALESGNLEHFVPRAGRLSAVLPSVLPRRVTERIGKLLGLNGVFYGINEKERSAYRDRIRSV